MAHFAKIENGIVSEVIVIPDDKEKFGQAFIRNKLKLPGEWIQTSYNSNIRKNFAGVGYSYRSDLDAFVPPSPGEEYELNEQTCEWELKEE